MANIYDTGFAGIVAITEVVTANAQAAILVEIAKLKALIPDPASATSGANPDFDQIQPHTAEKLRAEIDLLTTSIDGAPVI